ncbi:MAG: sulfotransferase, partial [Planctomycetota bacterium]
FPSGLVVHIVRDPRAVVHSRMNAAWSKDRPWWSHAIVAQEQLRRGRRLGRACFGERYLEVRYEELLARPRATLEAVCAHVDVPFDAAMLDFGGSARRLVAEDEIGWKKETFGPLLTDNDAKWRGGLDARQIGFIEAVCVEAFDRFGYERFGERPGPVRRAVLAGARAAGRSAYAARRWREARR